MVARPRKKLRWGFTTGTAAAAATKGALTFLSTGNRPGQVSVTLLTGDEIVIKVHSCEKTDSGTAVCSVIKDAGDDPDITHGAEIGAKVTLKPDAESDGVRILGGTGIGMVTKPGLEIEPGQAAINPGPRRMIRQTVAQVLGEGHRAGVTVEIFAPKGVALAHHTLNERLGIVGGISILGTTGVVKPLSHSAYIATIRSAMSVARASGLDRIVLTTGRRSERFAQQTWPQIPAEGFVQIGDYFEKSMAMAAEQGFKTVVLSVFFGKAVKMAQGIGHTHARSAQMTLEQLARWTRELTGNEILARQVAAANTARHAFEWIKDDHQAVIDKVGGEMIRSANIFADNCVQVQGVIFGFDGNIVFNPKD